MTFLWLCRQHRLNLRAGREGDIIERELFRLSCDRLRGLLWNIRGENHDATGTETQAAAYGEHRQGDRWQGGVVELILNAILCGGHVLIEDVPGVGKTTLASAFARSLALDYKRIQFTPDVTPSDVVGYTFIDFKTNVMEYRKGAVFANLLLADEINRTSPKTQSSLLEVMEEGQVTLDGETHPLPKPFIVLATQNPVDFVGTYPLRRHSWIDSSCACRSVIRLRRRKRRF